MAIQSRERLLLEGNATRVGLQWSMRQKASGFPTWIQSEIQSNNFQTIMRRMQMPDTICLTNARIAKVHHLGCLTSALCVRQPD